MTEAKFPFTNEGDVVPSVPFVSLYNKEDGSIPFSVYHYDFYDKYQVFYISKDQKTIQPFINETPLETHEGIILGFIKVIFDLIKEFCLAKMKLFADEESLLKKIKEGDIQIPEGEDYFEEMLKKTESEIEQKYNQEVKELAVSGWGKFKNKIEKKAEKLISYHTNYFNKNIGSYCSSDDYKGSNYISLKYLLIISFLAFIL